MNVLLFTRYDRRGASSRLRTLQYLPHLRRRGIVVDHQALLSGRYLDRHYRGERPPLLDLATTHAKRVARLLGRQNFDVAWIECELFPFLPAWFERLLVRRGIPYVVDYDDATFHRYDEHPSSLVRHLLTRKIGRVVRDASAVAAANEYLIRNIRAMGARKVIYLPTAVDLERYASDDLREDAQVPDGSRFRIGWIGTPVTAKFLLEKKEVLRDFARGRDITLVVIGAEIEMSGIDVECRPWSEATEVADLQSCDLGIMPLTDGPWERGKSGYKLIQYMACGKPVVASPVGANVGIVRGGQCGFLPESDAEWISALETLYKDLDLRRTMGANGQATVEQEYSIDATLPRLEAVLREAAVSDPALSRSRAAPSR